MKTTLLLILLLSSYLLFAQNNVSGCNLHGIITDSISGGRINAANVLVTPKTVKTYQYSASTDLNGKFAIDHIKENIVSITVSRIGYQTKTIDSLDLSEITFLGVIRLNPATYQMPEVVIHTIKPLVEYHVDRQIINIDQAPGGDGSLLDALKFSGIVKADNRTNAITVKGEGVRIQMDGIPYEGSADILAQLSSEIAEKIEVIVSPSAKESADAEPYIINIISKKLVKGKYSGSVNLTGSTNDRYISGANMQYKRGKFNFFSTLSFSSYKVTTSGYEEITHYNSKVFYLEKSAGTIYYMNKRYYFKTGFDYTIDTNSSFTLLSQYLKYDFRGENKQYRDVFSNELLPLYSFNYKYQPPFKSENISVYGSYKNNFNTKNKEFTADILFIKINRPSNTAMETDYSNREYPQKENTALNENAKTLIVKTEYSSDSPIGKFETGYDFTFRDRNVNSTSLDYLSEYDYWSDTARLSNCFSYKESINAAYLSYSKTGGRFEIKTGLRAENLYSRGTQYVSREEFTKNILNLFPNFNIAYNINDDHQISLNAFRRVSYPDMNYINPFKKYDGPNNYTAGNPTVEPLFTNSIALDFSPYLNVYYSKLKNRINYVTSVIQDSISYTSPVNIGSAELIGVELDLPYHNTPDAIITLPDFIRNFDIQIGYNRTNQYGHYLNENLSFSSERKWLDMDMSLKLWEDINATLMFSYEPKQTNARSSTNETQDLSCSLNKTFMEKSLKINFKISNILNYNESRESSYGTAFKIYSFDVKRKARCVSLSISYRFNDFKEHQERNIDDNRDVL